MSLLQSAPQRTGCCLNFSFLNPKPDVSPRDSRSLEGWNLLPSQGHVDHSSVCSLGTDSEWLPWPWTTFQPGAGENYLVHLWGVIHLPIFELYELG